jgi:tetratricopeptide (TPR) repeat protein/tRNA A-37 threonylcarbamoyl transferase component Bud32
MSQPAQDSRTFDTETPPDLRPWVERFEDAWEAGTRPDIDAHLPPGPGRRAVLVELVHIDLERRLKAGQPARVEDYLARYADLADAAVVLDLAAAEFSLRRRSEPGLDTAEYARRFPDLAGHLPARLTPAAPDTPAAPSTRVEAPAVPETRAEGPAPAAPASLPSGPRYRPVRFHARGGLGEVHVAEDGELRRDVALKRIRPEYAHDPGSRARFLREAEVTAKLEHPGVVPVHGLMLDAEGQPCYAMRFVQGQTLQEAARRFHEADRAKRDPGERALALRQLLTRFVAVCDTVAYAHSRGVLHRDLKPANVMLGPYGETLVLDWGLAGTFDRGDEARASAEESVAPSAASAEETPAGKPLGTPAYMAPEQAAGRWDLVGPPTDVYGLGATLYELLTGVAPFRGPALDVLGRVRRGTFEAPRQVSKRVPPALEAVCLKAMALRAEGRYPSAKALGQDVERWLADEPVSAWREPLRVRARRWARRHRTGVSTAAAVLLCAALAAGAALYQARQARAESDRRVARDSEQAAAALDKAEWLRGQARQVPLAERARWVAALAQWREALLAAEQAARLGAAGDLEEAVRARLNELLPRLRREVEEAEQDRAMVATLESIRLQMTEVRDGQFAAEAAVPLYAQAFREYGADVAALSPAAAAEALGGRAIRDELVAALLDWRRLEPGPDRKRHLSAVARALVPSGVPTPPPAVAPWTEVAWAPDSLLGRLRAAHERKDRAGLQAVVDGADVSGLPPALLQNVGWDLILAGYADVAVSLLRRAQRQHPSDFWLNHYLGTALKWSRPPRTEEAVGFYRAAVALRPQSPGAHLNLGTALLDLGRTDEALACYDEALRLKPDYAKAHASRGTALQRRGELDRAALACQEAIRLAPALALAHNNLAAVRLAQGRLGEGAAACRVALYLAPDLALAWNNLGAALARQGKPAEAVAACRQALRLRPDFAEAHLNLGAALRDLGKLGEGAAAYREAIRLKPEDAMAWYNLAKALDREGKPDEAVAAYREALRLRPDYPDALTNLGGVLRQQGKLADAVAACQEALRLQPDHAFAWCNLGNALYAQRKLPEAVEACRKAIRLKSDLPEAHLSLGNALDDLGHFPEAEAAYREALHLKPDYADAHVNLGMALARQGKRDAAVAAFREALRLEPNSPPAHLYLGITLCDQGKSAEALPALREAVRLQPESSQAHYGLGRALAARGQLAEAEAAYRHAIRLRPDYPEAHCNLGLLLKDQGRYAEAVPLLKRGHELGSKNPRWPYPSAGWVRAAEQLLAFDRKLTAVLDGKAEAGGAEERLVFAQLCQHFRRRPAAAARFYAEALAAKPKFAEDRTALHRYNAACAAALAGSGSGDGDKCDDKERARWRRQALGWLRAELGVWAQSVEKGPPQDRPKVRQALEHWRKDADLAGVRDADALAKLPEAERADWQKFWAEVGALLKRVSAAK